VKEIILCYSTDNYPYSVIYDDQNDEFITTHGSVHSIPSHQYDLTHEIIPEPEAQGLDWSGVIKTLHDAAYKFHKRKVNDCGDLEFKQDALAILQQFERECIQTTPLCIHCDAQKIQTSTDLTGNLSDEYKAPCVVKNPNDINGLTLRDYFAVAALQGLLSDQINPSEELFGHQTVASRSAADAYLLADAMLKARGEIK
jgi:hypothetical protein